MAGQDGPPERLAVSPGIRRPGTPTSAPGPFFSGAAPLAFCPWLEYASRDSMTLPRVTRLAAIVRRRRESLLVLVVFAVSLIPVAGVFTLSNIFFVRDLGIAFRSRFLFFRQTIWSGSFPLWDPYPANGQPAVNDALYQLFHLPSLPIRLLLPEVVAYNVWIALPIPLCALGMYLFLRRHVSPPVSVPGATVVSAEPTASPSTTTVESNSIPGGWSSSTVTR